MKAVKCALQSVQLTLSAKVLTLTPPLPNKHTHFLCEHSSEISKATTATTTVKSLDHKKGRR